MRSPGCLLDGAVQKGMWPAVQSAPKDAVWHSVVLRRDRPDGGESGVKRAAVVDWCGTCKRG